MGRLRYGSVMCEELRSPPRACTRPYEGTPLHDLTMVPRGSGTDGLVGGEQLGDPLGGGRDGSSRDG